MNGALPYLLEVALIQGIALLAYYLLLERQPLGILKRVYLLAAPLLAFTLPLCTVAVETVVVLPLMVDTIIPSVPVIEIDAETTVNYWSVLLWVLYTLGVSVQLVRFCRSLLAVRQLRVRAVGQLTEGGVQWVSVAARVPVHTFGRTIFYPVTVMLNPAVREHERTHALQLHSLDRVWTALLRTIFWFNPVLYGYERAIKHNHELLADRGALLRTGLSVRQYQQYLLCALMAGRPTALVSGLSFPFTKQRFQMLQLPTPAPRRTVVRIACLLTIWTCLLLGFGATTFAQVTPPPPLPPAFDAPPPPPLPPVFDAPAPPPPPLPPADWKKPLPRPEGYTGSTNAAEMDAADRLRYRLAAHLSLKPSTVTTESLAFPSDPNVFGVWLDGIRINNDRLTDLQVEDIYRMWGSQLRPNAPNYNQYTYHIVVITRAGFDATTERLRAEIAAL